MTAIINVVIADDHPLMRAALREAIAANVGGAILHEAASVALLIDILRRLIDVDVVLLDLMMPDSRGFSALVQLRTQFPGVPVVVVSSTEDADVVDRALLLGASGYIVKSTPVEAVGRMLRDVLNGQVVRPTRRSTTTLREEDLSRFRKLRTLTPQQFNVLVMIAEGCSNRQIADNLKIAESTVKVHNTAILLKLGLQSRTQAAVLAQHALQLRNLPSGWESSLDSSGGGDR